MFDGLVLRRTDLNSLGISIRYCESGWRVRQIQYNLANPEWYVLIHCYVRPFAGPNPLISSSFSFFPSSGSHTQTHGSGWYQCMRFYFQARGFPKPAMYNNILFLGINAMLNYLLVFGGPSFLHWDGLGFIGAAISLSVSRTLQGVFYYLYMFVYQKHHITAWPDEGWSLTIHTRERTTEFMKQALPNIGTLLFQSCTYSDLLLYAVLMF